MRTAARLFIFVLLFSIFNFQLSTPVFAQVNPYAIPQTNADVPQNMHTWSQSVFIEVLSATACQLSGVDPINPQQKCLGIDQKTGKIGFVENSGGAIGMTANAITMFYTPPIHTSDFFAYLGENFGITKKVYAQGTGFTSLTPLLSLWTAFRNIVYLAFVVVFVVVGLAIMLRLKIDPRTVMSIENQLPKLIIGILLVTFSFAIAGLFIDLMYVSMYLVYNTIASVPDVGSNVSGLNPAVLQGKSPLDAAASLGGNFGLFNLARIVAEAGKDIVQHSLGITPFVNFKGGLDFGSVQKLQESLGNLLGLNLKTIADLIISLVSVGTAFAAAKNVVTLLSFIPGISQGAAIPFGLFAYSTSQFILREALPFLLIYIVVFIAMLWALFRLAFELLKAYIFILIDIVLAPFWIIAGVFPGSPAGFGAWLRSLAANLSVFPVTLGMFLLGNAFMAALNNTTPLFAPPLVGNPSGGQASPLGAIIGIGIILLTPQVVAMMKDLLKSPQLKYTAAIGQAVAVGAGAVNAPNIAKEIGMYRYYTNYLQGLPIIGPFLGQKGNQRTGGQTH